MGGHKGELAAEERGRIPSEASKGEARKGEMHKSRITVLVAMMALLLVASAGIAYAAEGNLGRGDDTFTEDNDPQCENDTINGGRGTDRLRFNTSNPTNCPAGDVDVGNGGPGGGDVVNVADLDEQDTASGGGGGGDRCIIGEDQNNTADPADDTRDTVGKGCETVRVRSYDEAA